jgi:large subunit ribosomal protein L13
MPAVLDASGQVVGRFSAAVAKRLLNGEEIVVVNAEKAVITGSKSWIIEEFHQRRDRGSQRMGPFYPRRAERILHRAIRGMLPYQQPRGRAALKRLRVYVQVPEGYKEAPKERVEGADRIRTARFLTLEQIAMRLGGEV